WAATMQIAWEMASTVFSHSRLAEERSSTRRAFSSAIAACASTAQTSVSSALPSTPGRSLERETAPIVRLAAMSGAPSQEPGGGRVGGQLRPAAPRLFAYVLGERERPVPQRELQQGVVGAGRNGVRVVGHRQPVRLGVK